VRSGFFFPFSFLGHFLHTSAFCLILPAARRLKSFQSEPAPAFVTLEKNAVTESGFWKELLFSGSAAWPASVVPVTLPVGNLFPLKATPAALLRLGHLFLVTRQGQKTSPSQSFFNPPLIFSSHLKFNLTGLAARWASPPSSQKSPFCGQKEPLFGLPLARLGVVAP